MTGGSIRLPFGKFLFYTGYQGDTKIFLSGHGWIEESQFWKEVYKLYPEHAPFIMGKILGNDPKEG